MPNVDCTCQRHGSLFWYTRLHNSCSKNYRVMSQR